MREFRKSWCSLIEDKWAQIWKKILLWIDLKGFESIGCVHVVGFDHLIWRARVTNSTGESFWCKCKKKKKVLKFWTWSSFGRCWIHKSDTFRFWLKSLSEFSRLWLWMVLWTSQNHFVTWVYLHVICVWSELCGGDKGVIMWTWPRFVLHFTLKQICLCFCKSDFDEKLSVVLKPDWALTRV